MFWLCLFFILINLLVYINHKWTDKLINEDYYVLSYLIAIKIHYSDATNLTKKDYKNIAWCYINRLEDEKYPIPSFGLDFADLKNLKNVPVETVLEINKPVLNFYKLRRLHIKYRRHNYTEWHPTVNKIVYWRYKDGTVSAPRKSD